MNDVRIPRIPASSESTFMHTNLFVSALTFLLAFFPDLQHNSTKYYFDLFVWHGMAADERVHTYRDLAKVGVNNDDNHKQWDNDKIFHHNNIIILCSMPNSFNHSRKHLH